MKLKKSLIVSIVAMGLIVVAGAAAKPKDSKDVVLHHDVTIAGSHLASGNYNIQWQTHSPGATVTFSHGSKVVATAEGKVENRGTKYGANQVVYSEAGNGAHAIQEIRFRGSSEVLVFNE
ncbi:MAG: hypothetical protein P4N24_11280 [Acidobacteriota bacterium]|nr:hypothetical protein [Acidobacteriota bacterium]